MEYLRKKSLLKWGGIKNYIGEKPWIFFINLLWKVTVSSRGKAHKMEVRGDIQILVQLSTKRLKHFDCCNYTPWNGGIIIHTTIVVTTTRTTGNSADILKFKLLESNWENYRHHFRRHVIYLGPENLFSRAKKGQNRHFRRQFINYFLL